MLYQVLLVVGKYKNKSVAGFLVQLSLNCQPTSNDLETYY